MLKSSSKNFLTLVFGVLLTFVVWVTPSFAQDLTEDYVNNFRSDVILDQSTDINITETIDYHFGTSHHGMYREIPTNYKVTASFQRPTTLVLESLYYFDKDFPSIHYDSYERSTENGYVTLQIGDADTTIIGDYIFVIKYKLVHAVNYFDDHDELYLNINGSGWTVPINSITARIQTPGDINQKVCYTGEYDSVNTNCTITDIDSRNVTVTASNLLEYEGLTVALGMPKGTLADTTKQQTLEFLLANIGVLLPIPVLVLLIVLVKKINKNKKITIIPHYNAPKDINPLKAGYIYSKSITNPSVSAQIIQMAINGYIKIKQISEKSYEIVKTEKSPTEASEVILYNGLFGEKDSINMKDLSNKFYITVGSLKANIDKYTYEEGYFSIKTKGVKDAFSVLGTIGLMVSFVLIPFLSEIAAGGWSIGLIISFIILLISAGRIDIRDVKGNDLFYKLKGLKMYIDTAEKERIKFHSDPKKYKDIFVKLLPYAIIFGLEGKWVKEFEEIYTESPDWYVGTTPFRTSILSNYIYSTNSSIRTHSVPPTASRGFYSSGGASGGSGFSGGSSGGGFGGGGGGSW